VQTTTKLQRNEPYGGRPATSIPVQLSFDPETARLLQTLAPGCKGRSRYVTRLVWAEQARQEERQRLRTLLEEAQGGAARAG
jgi:hypothetical protein